MNNFLHNSLFSGIPLTKFASASLYSDFSLSISKRLPCSTQCHPHVLQCRKCFQELPCLFSFSQESVLILFNVCVNVVACELSSCVSQALERRLSSCDSWVQLLRAMWDLPRPGLEPVSPALADRFLTTMPPGKSLICFKYEYVINFTIQYYTFLH